MFSFVLFTVGGWGWVGVVWDVYVVGVVVSAVVGEGIFGGGEYAV